MAIICHAHAFVAKSFLVDQGRVHAGRGDGPNNNMARPLSIHSECEYIDLLYNCVA